MAKVYNPLHKFRSYQYHFVWVLAKSQAALIDLDNDSDLNVLDHPYDSNPEKRATMKYDLKKTKGGNEYVVFYNSRTDAEFSIDDLEIKNTMTAGAHNYTAVGSEIKLQITEPYSVDFFTALTYAADKLGLSLTTANLMHSLKVIFVGYPDEHHRGEPQYITNINFFTFNILEAKISVTTRGAQYNIQGVPKFGGMALDPNVNKAGGISTTVSEVLSEAVAKLENVLNEQAEKIKKEGKTPIKYRILIDPAYNDPKYKLDLVSNDQKNLLSSIGPQIANDSALVPSSADSKQSDKKEDQKKPEPIIYNTKAGAVLDKSIHELFQLSSEVLNEKLKPDETDPDNPVIYEPSIISNYGINEKDKEHYAIFYVARRPSSVAKKGKELKAKSNPADKLSNFLEYDYIYTGKNIDIIQFDMHAKIAMAMVGNYKVIQTPPFRDNKELKHITANDPEKTNDSTDVNGTDTKAVDGREDSAAGMPTVDTSRFGSGSLNPQVLFDGRRAMDKSIWQDLANGCTILLTGNPMLLAGYMFPADTFEKENESTGEEVKQKLDDHEKNIGLTSVGMVNVKVNVRMPKPKYLQGQSTGDDDNFYSSPFWLANSFYQIVAMISKFQRGKFTQLVEMRAMPDAGQGMEPYTDAAEKKPKEEEQKQTQSDDVSGDNLKAFLKMIGMAETGLKGNDGYNVRYGGVIFDGYNDHPWNIKPWSSGDGKKHSPAGRYQIVIDTYNANKSKAGGDFSPGTQDKIAVMLLKGRGAYNDVIAGKPKEAIKKLYNEWSSLRPGTHSEAQLLKWYESYGGTYRPQKESSVGNGSSTPKSNVPATKGDPKVANVLKKAGYEQGTPEYEMALAIGSKEGWVPKANGGKGSRAYRNNNPGNLDYSDDLKKYDPNVTFETGPNGKGRFAKFSTPEAGAKALVEGKITRWANGKMPVTPGNQTMMPGGKYKKGSQPTIKEFFYTYAPPNENDTKGYINGVVKSLNNSGYNVNENTKVADLLKKR